MISSFYDIDMAHETEPKPRFELVNRIYKKAARPKRIRLCGLICI